MNITVLKGESSDLLGCQEPNAKPIYIAVPRGSTDHLRSAADWAEYFASGNWSEKAPATMRVAHRPAHQPAAPRDGYAEAIEQRRGNVTAITASGRFATGHTSSPDGYAEALGHRATVHSFPSANTHGYLVALARRRES